MFHRRSIRLQNYDYTQAGAYFVTICAHARDCLFGDVINGEMRLNEYGKTVEECWDDIARHFDDVELDSFTIMPNHVHGIIVFTNTVGAGFPRPDSKLKSNDVDAETADKGAETADKGAETADKGAETADKGAETAVKGAETAVKGAETAVKGAETAPLRKRRTLGNVVAYFKYQSTKRLNLKRNTPAFAVWQRNYYEHIVRDEIDLNRIHEYIQCNPARWAEDENNPKRVK